MNWHTVSLPLIVVGVVLYHLAQKSIPKEASSLIALGWAYFVAMGISVVALLMTGELRKGWDVVQNQSWIAVVLLGLSAFAIELGFLYAYRTGWSFSTTAVVTMPFIAVSLALIGTLWFKESLSLTNIIGMGLSLVGVALIQIK